MNRRSQKCLARYFAALMGGILFVGLSAGGWALGLQLTGNIHVVEMGALYRSAQLNGESLAKVLTQYGIRSVINLRGMDQGKWWYQNERSVTAAYGAAHFDVGMGATSEPDASIIVRLLEIMRTAPRPILIHCQSGSDRTGLAAALYERFVNGQSAELAARQLSFQYGHFPWLGSGTGAMDKTFWHLSAQNDGMKRQHYQSVYFR